MSEATFTAVSTVGVVADIRRDGEGDYVATKCSVFGINEEEYNMLGSVCEIRPKYFTLEAERFMVLCRWVEYQTTTFITNHSIILTSIKNQWPNYYNFSPWKAMRKLGDNFGYYLPVPPLTGRVEGNTGDRKTCIWTLHRKRTESIKWSTLIYQCIINNLLRYITLLNSKYNLTWVCTFRLTILIIVICLHDKVVRSLFLSIQIFFHR